MVKNQNKEMEEIEVEGAEVEAEAMDEFLVEEFNLNTVKAINAVNGYLSEYPEVKGSSLIEFVSLVTLYGARALLDTNDSTGMKENLKSWVEVINRSTNTLFEVLVSDGVEGDEGGVEGDDCDIRNE